MPLDAEGLKIHRSGSRIMERSNNFKHFRAVYSWCVLAISLLGCGLGRGAWTSGKMAVHNTALRLQEHAELADHTQLVFFSLSFSFHWGLSPASFLHFLDKILSRYLQDSLFGNSLSQVLRKIWKKPTWQGLEHIVPHSLHISIPPTSCYLRACSGPEHFNCAGECI